MRIYFFVVAFLIGLGNASSVSIDKKGVENRMSKFNLITEHLENDGKILNAS